MAHLRAQGEGTWKRARVLKEAGVGAKGREVAARDAIRECGKRHELSGVDKGHVGPVVGAIREHGKRHEGTAGGRMRELDTWVGDFVVLQKHGDVHEEGWGPCCAAKA